MRLIFATTAAFAILAFGLMSGGAVAQPSPQSSIPPSTSPPPATSEPISTGIELRDLAAQESMARSAEAQIKEARTQSITNALSVGLGGVASIISVAALLVAMRTGRRQLRAYLMPDHVAVLHPTHDPDYKKKRPRPGDLPMIQVHLKNYGSTPATNVLHWVGFELLPFGAEHRLVAPRTMDRVSEGAVAPGGIITKHLLLERAVTPGEAADFALGKVALYVCGRVTYRDIFRVERETNFLLRYQGVWPPPVTNNLFYCDTGNSVT